MSRAILSMHVLAIYLFIVGTILVLTPNTLLTRFGMPSTPEVWIRVIGVLAINIGVFAWVAAKHSDQHFMAATVYTRIFFFVATGVFAGLGLVSSILMIFGLLDLAGALWTRFAMQADARSAPRF